jgi:KaiC/GvpD/RAD55 family RecA-like ATPase
MRQGTGLSGKLSEIENNLPVPESMRDYMERKQTPPLRTTKGCMLFRQTKPTTMERPKKIIGVMWAQGENAILFGEDGSGKTIFGVMAACAVAAGGSFQGFENELDAQPVALFDAELSDYQFNNRYPEGLHPNLTRFTFDEGQQKALIGATVEFVVTQIEAAANTIGAKILILDNLSALTSMLDLTKTADSIQLMGLLNDLKRKGFSTLIIDHTRKPMKEGDFKPISKHDLQGSKMKSNLVDSAFGIGKSSQGENIRYIKAVKIRSFEMDFTKNCVATLELKAAPLRLEYTGRSCEWEHVNDRNSEMQRMSSAGKTQVEIAKTFNISQQAVSKALNND